MFNFIVLFQEAPAGNKKSVVTKSDSVPVAKTVKADSSSESSSEEDSSSDEVSIILMLIILAWLRIFFCMIVNVQLFVLFQEAPAQKKKPVVAKSGSIPAAKTVKVDSSSESSSEEDSSSDEVSLMLMLY